MKKILFLNPPPFEGINVIREGRCMQRTGAWTSVWAPVSLATTAAVVREAGFEPMIVDCSVEDMDEAGLSALISSWQPDLVVINTATPSIDSDIAVSSLAKAAYPGTKTLAMGIHPSALPESCFEMDAGLDMVVRGEPEYTIRDDCILGFPGETETTMQQTIDFSKFLKLEYVQFYGDVANFARMVKDFLTWV